MIELAPPEPGEPSLPPPGARDVELGLGRRSAIGGYGEAQLFTGAKTELRLRRFVAFLGYRFTDWVRVYTETEVSDGTDVQMEQAVLELAPAPGVGVRAGLLLLPLGIVNQLHEPPTLLTVDRPLTDQLIIPTTWRELGVGLFGDLGSGFAYQGTITSGLDPAGFAAQAPLAGARGNGRSLEVHDPAFAGRLDYTGVQGLDVGAAGYVGWARGGRPELANVWASVLEADARYRAHGFDLRAEYAQLYVINSYRINDYLGLSGADAIGARGRGFYLQAGYDLFRLLASSLGHELSQELVLFAGYENVNPRSRMSPYNTNPPAIIGAGEPSPNAPSPSQSFLRAGLAYRPQRQVAVKLDLQLALSDAAPPAVAAAPLPGATGTQTPLSPDVAQAAKGESRLGVAVAFMF